MNKYFTLFFSFFFFSFSVSTGHHEQIKKKIIIIGQLQPNLKKTPAQKIDNPRFKPKKGDTRAHLEHISPFQTRSLLSVKVDFDNC